MPKETSRILLNLTLLFLLFGGVAQGTPNPVSVQESGCHIFIDYQFIWTLEIVSNPSGGPIPILNIITFDKGEWDFRPDQIHILSDAGTEAQVNRFSIDTGVPGEPYIVHYLKVLGNSFIGMDLKGDFEGYDQVKEVSIELGDTRFVLEPIDCLEYENVAQKINLINYESPNIREDFEVLKIEFMGKREARRRFY